MFVFFFGSLSSFSRNSIYSIHYTYYSLAVSGLLSTFFLCLFLLLNQCALFSVNSKYNLVVFSLLCFVLHFDSSFFGFWYFVLSAFFVVFVSSLGLLYSLFFTLCSSFLCWFSLRYAVLMFTSFIFTLLLFMWINDILLEGVLVFSRTEQFSLIFGIKLLILSEFMLFFCLFWTEINFRFILNVFIFMLPLLSSFTFAIPYTNVIVLLFSSLPIQATLIFYKVGLFFSCVEQLGQTVSCGTVFLVLQLKEFFYSFHSIADCMIGSVFYFTTGLHGAHVLFGLFYFWIILFLYCAVLFSWYNMLCYVAFFFDSLVIFDSFMNVLFGKLFTSLFLITINIKWFTLCFIYLMFLLLNDVLIRYFLTSLLPLNLVYSRALYYMLFALPNMLSLSYILNFFVSLRFIYRFYWCFFFCFTTVINALILNWFLFFFFLCIFNSFSFIGFFACFFFSFSYLALTLAIDTLVFSLSFYCNYSTKLIVAARYIIIYSCCFCFFYTICSCCFFMLCFFMLWALYLSFRLFVSLCFEYLVMQPYIMFYLLFFYLEYALLFELFNISLNSLCCYYSIYLLSCAMLCWIGFSIFFFLLCFSLFFLSTAAFLIIPYLLFIWFYFTLFSFINNSFSLYFYYSSKVFHVFLLFVFYYYLRWSYSNFYRFLLSFNYFNLRWFYYCFYFLFNFSCFNCFYHKRKSFIVFACFYSFAQSFTQFSTYFFVEFSESLFYSSYYWHFVDIIWLVVFILYFFIFSLWKSLLGLSFLCCFTCLIITFLFIWVT